MMEHYHPKDEMKRYVRAFIYLATKLGKEKSVAEDLWGIPEIKEVHIIPGKYDILAIAEVERKFLEPDSHNIYWFLLSRIEGIAGIEDTSTIIPVISMSHWSHQNTVGQRIGFAEPLSGSGSRSVYASFVHY